MDSSGFSKSDLGRLYDKTDTVIIRTIDESQCLKSIVSIVPKYNLDFSNAICIHGDLIAGFQHASELVDAIKFRLREKLRRNAE